MNFRNGFKIIIAIAFLIGLACTDDPVEPEDNDYNNDNVPEAPSLFSGNALSDSSIYLHWIDNALDEDYFVLYRGQNDTPAPVDTIPANTSTYIDYGLEEVTTYSYFLTAVNENGSSNTTDTVDIATLPINDPPNQPFNPSPPDSALGRDTDTLMLSWQCTDPDDDDTLSYSLYLGRAIDDNMELIAEDLAGPSYQVFDLLGRTEYNWQVEAIDKYDESTQGPIWTFTTEEIPR
jgi:hypothetical protein